MARQWQQLSLEGAKRHPLYGIKNWLAVFAFGVLIAPFRSIGGVSNAAREAGLTLSQLLNADISTGAFVTSSMAFDSAVAGLLLWLLFSKNRHFRVASISLLVLQWPAYFVVAFITGGTKIPGFVGVFVFQFFGGLLLTVIWVAYLQRSRRVRVTFENCVVVEKKSTSQIRGNGMPVPTTQASSSGNDAYAAALAEIEEGRLDKGVWARAFADAGGEDAKAKALYIKARAGAAKSSVVWENTQPSVVEERDTSVPTAQTKYGFFRTAGRMYGYLCARHLAPSSWLGVGAVVLASMLAIYAYREYRGLQVVAGPTTASQPMAQVSPDQSDWGKGDQPTQSAPGWGDKDAMATPARPNLVPFNGKLDDAPSTSAQSDNDKAMKEHFRLVYAAHPDIEAVLASAGFRAWLVKYPAYERIVVKGTAPEVIGMLNTYKKQNQLPGAAAQSPNAFYKCTGPSGVVYQATPCGTASN